MGYAAVPMTVLAARPRRVLTGLAVLVAATGAPLGLGGFGGDGMARAQRPVASETPPAPSTEAQAKAQEHYKHARELYQVGSYREASAELESALALDPSAKELVFNLGVVSEKLGKFDEALRYFRHYSEMSLSAAEKQRADGLIKRLEGAKNEVVVTPPPPPAAPETAKIPEKPENGRIDTATIVVASVAVAGLGVGTVLGIKALADKPKSGFVTGRDGSYADLQRSADSAHTEAIVADIALGVGVAAAAVAAYLYFARPKVVAAPSPSRASVSIAPTAGGGAIFLRGSF